MKIEIVTFVVKGSAKLTVPTDRCPKANHGRFGTNINDNSWTHSNISREEPAFLGVLTSRAMNGKQKTP